MATSVPKTQDSVPYTHDQISDDTLRNALRNGGFYNKSGLHSFVRCVHCGAYVHVDSLLVRGTDKPELFEKIGVVPPRVIEGTVGASNTTCDRCYTVWSKNRDLVELFRSMVEEHERKFHSKK